jgi:hypothetical protein
MNWILSPKPTDERFQRFPSATIFAITGRAVLSYRHETKEDDVQGSHHRQNAEIGNNAGSKNNRLTKIIAIALVASLLQLPVTSAVFAEETVEERTQSTGEQFGMGAASFFATLPYGIIKVVYATLGGIIGGFTYVLTAGNEKAANAVWDTSLRGTYVITPDHLKGDKPVRFFGVPPEAVAESPEPPASATEPAPVPTPAK